MNGFNPEEIDLVAAPLVALMQRLDQVNPIWTKFVLERGPDGEIHFVLSDAFDTGH